MTRVSRRAPVAAACTTGPVVSTQWGACSKLGKNPCCSTLSGCAGARHCAGGTSTTRIRATYIVPIEPRRERCDARCVVARQTTESNLLRALGPLATSSGFRAHCLLQNASLPAKRVEKRNGQRQLGAPRRTSREAKGGQARRRAPRKAKGPARRPPGHPECGVPERPRRERLGRRARPSSAPRTFEMATARTGAASGATPRPSRLVPSATGATTEPPLEQVPTVAAQLDGAVPKAEYNDVPLVTGPGGVVARVLDWCSAYRRRRRGDVQALRRAASLSVGVRAQKLTPRGRDSLAARRRRVPRMARSVRFAGATRRRPPRSPRCGGARRLPRILRPARAYRGPAARRAPAARPFNKLLEEAAAARARSRRSSAPCPDAGAAAVAATSRRPGPSQRPTTPTGGGGGEPRRADLCPS